MCTKSGSKASLTEERNRHCTSGRCSPNMSPCATEPIFVTHCDAESHWVQGLLWGNVLISSSHPPKRNVHLGALCCANVGADSLIEIGVPFDIIGLLIHVAFSMLG